MSRRKRNPVRANHERWLVSYADFITLLFAFFVVLYASSHADQKKAAVVAESIKGAFHQLGVFSGSTPGDVQAPAPTVPEAGHTDAPERLMKVAGDSDTPEGSLVAGVDVTQLRRELEGALGDEIQKKEVQMRMTPEGLVVSLKEVGFFRSGDAELLQDGQATLARIAGILGGKGFEIRIEGHTDNVRIHTAKFKSNWELSTSRATQVVSLLIEKHGFNPKLISAAGYSEFRPVASNDTEQGRAANRRIDLIVVGKAAGAGQETPPAEETSPPAATQ
jgi:chemotaxis protein MotB